MKKKEARFRAMRKQWNGEKTAFLGADVHFDAFAQVSDLGLSALIIGRSLVRVPPHVISVVAGTVIGPVIGWLQLYRGLVRRARIDSRGTWEDFGRGVERLHADMLREVGK
jgi:hypothetical protein